MSSLRISRLCIADRSVSDSKEGLCKDDALGIAGPVTGKVGKCRLTRAYTYPTSSGSFQRISEKGTDIFHNNREVR